MCTTRAEEVCLVNIDSIILILGAFNLPHVKWLEPIDLFLGVSDTKSLDLKDCLNISGCKQINNFSNDNEKCLDLASVSEHVNISICQALSKTDVHHPPLELVLNNNSHADLIQNTSHSIYYFLEQTMNLVCMIYY